MNIIKIIKQGGVGVMATDTIYGLVGSALAPATVQRIYRLKKRPKNKPLIILISQMADLQLFDCQTLNVGQIRYLGKIWPGPVSVILPVGKKSLAFRIPRPIWLRKLLHQTGPLIATSANIAGQPPARTIAVAKHYFGNRVDFYLAGRTGRQPSTLIRLTGEKIVVLRGKLKLL